MLQTDPKLRRSTISVVALLFAVAACTDESATGSQFSPSAAAVQNSVTGQAALALGADGRFRFSSSANGSERELTSEEAVNLASAWVNERAPMIRGWLEKTHGGSIDFKKLASCGRALYAHSAFDASATQDLPVPFRRVNAAWWLVTLCEGNAPSVSVAVSALNTDLSILNGKIQFPRISGNEFVPIGIPVGHVGEYPISPELAVQMTAERSGHRIRNLPDLITPLPSDGPPQLARWHLTLDGEAVVHIGGTLRHSNEVFVGPTHVGGADIVTSIPSLDQPTSTDLKTFPVPDDGENEHAYKARAGVQTRKLLRRAGTPVRFETVSTWGN